ncbi:MAG: hypothetical protein EOM15_12900 [Spirochaetia bacterium]|nr:hypothetical protein [Spirochaetia bacterium]
MTKQEVLETITEYSEWNLAISKYAILNNLDEEDTNENRKQLDKILKELKDEGIIGVFQIYGDDNHFRGRGYALND